MVGKDPKRRISFLFLKEISFIGRFQFFEFCEFYLTK